MEVHRPQETIDLETLDVPIQEVVAAAVQPTYPNRMVAEAQMASS
jgi:hypothetical protein